MRQHKYEDHRFSSMDLLRECDGVADYSLFFAGFATSVWSLAQAGYELRIRQKFGRPDILKCVFSNGKQCFSLRIKGLEWRTGYLGILLSNLSCAYQRDVNIGLYLADGKPYQQQALADYSEETLLSELSRRIDAKPVKKKPKIPPPNVINFTEILERLQKTESIERKVL